MITVPGFYARKGQPPQVATESQAKAANTVAKPNLAIHRDMVSAKSMGFFTPKNTSHIEKSKEGPPPEFDMASANPRKSNSNSNHTS